MRRLAPAPEGAMRGRGGGVSAACVFLPQGSRRDERWSERSGEAGEPTGAREHVCGPGVILTAGVKGAREMHLRRSRQVPRRAQRGALRSKVARGCARASKSCRWGARKLRVGRAGRAKASPSGGAAIARSRNTPLRGSATALRIKKSAAYPPSRRRAAKRALCGVQMCRGRFFIRGEGR